MEKTGLTSAKEKGSILVIAMIFGVLLLTSTGVLLKYGITEKIINERHFQRLEAQAAAESAVEYGFAEAHTTYGVLGIKVWINKGEVIKKKKRPFKSVKK